MTNCHDFVVVTHSCYNMRPLVIATRTVCSCRGFSLISGLVLTCTASYRRFSILSIPRHHLDLSMGVVLPEPGHSHRRSSGLVIRHTFLIIPGSLAWDMVPRTEFGGQETFGSCFGTLGGGGRVDYVLEADCYTVQ